MAIVTLSYFLYCATKDAKKALATLQANEWKPEDIRYPVLTYLECAEALITFDYATEYNNGLNDECEFVENDFNLHEVAKNYCKGFVAELKKAGIYATVDYYETEVDDIAKELADAAPIKSHCGNI